MKYSLFAPKGLAKYVAGKPLAQGFHETALALFASGQYSGHAQGVRDERIRQESVRALRDNVAAKRAGLARVEVRCR